MEWGIILQVVLLGLALSADAFAVSVSDGLIYKDINKKKGIIIALTFGLMQAIMPLISYWLIEVIKLIVGNEESAGKILGTIVTWAAAILLLFIGTKMVIEGIKEVKKNEEKKKTKCFSFKEVFILGIATSIDAMGAGVALHTGISNDITIFLHVSIIMCITFILSLIGVFLGNIINKIFKGKYEITTIIGGCILLLLSIWIVLEYYLF